MEARKVEMSGHHGIELQEGKKSAEKSARNLHKGPLEPLRKACFCRNFKNAVISM